MEAESRESSSADAAIAPLNKGIEEGWIRPRRRLGKIGQESRMKSQRKTDDVIAEDRLDRL